MFELCQRIQETWLSQAISGSTWGFPIVAALHVLTIACFGGAVLVTDLRLLGMDLATGRIADLTGELVWFKRAGFTALLATGMLLFWSEPVHCYESAAFQAKMLLLVLLGVNGVTLRRGINSWDETRVPPLRRKSAAWVSLLLWLGLVIAGRAIAFF
jgi:hypothetical protein